MSPFCRFPPFPYPRRGLRLRPDSNPAPASAITPLPGSGRAVIPTCGSRLAASETEILNQSAAALSMISPSAPTLLAKPAVLRFAENADRSALESVELPAAETLLLVSRLVD